MKKRSRRYLIRKRIGRRATAPFYDLTQKTADKMESHGIMYLLRQGGEVVDLDDEMKKPFNLDDAITQMIESSDRHREQRLRFYANVLEETKQYMDAVERETPGTLQRLYDAAKKNR